jgi:hypothetical protein
MRRFSVSVTRGGESTTLTYRMLQNLREQTVYVSGRVTAWLRDGMAFGPPRTPPPALLDQPVLHVSLTCSIGMTPDDHDRTMPLETTIFSGDLRAPIVLLMEQRPKAGRGRLCTGRSAHDGRVARFISARTPPRLHHPPPAGPPLSR